MNVRFLHVASSYRIGLTNQETELALAYHDHEELDAMVVTGEKEQFAGCFSRLEQSKIPFSVIRGFDDHDDFMRLVKEFILIVDGFQPSIVTVNTNWQLLIVGISRIISRKHFKIVYTIHGFRHNHKAKSVIARFLIGTLLWVFADMIIAPSSYVAKKFSFLNRKIVHVPLGEDEVFFKRSTAPDFNKPISFCFPGEFRAGKNQHILIEAFIDFVEISGNQDSMLYLPGSGPLLDALQESVRKAGFSDRIHFPGQLDRNNILDLYRQCQVVVVPSNEETFGHCIAEPLVLQRIVLTRPVGLAVDHLLHGDNGFLFETKDELVRLLLYVVSLGPDKLALISRSAKETGESFRWKHVVNNIQKEVFNPLISP